MKIAVKRGAGGLKSNSLLLETSKHYFIPESKNASLGFGHQWNYFTIAFQSEKDVLGC